MRKLFVLTAVFFASLASAQQQQLSRYDGGQTVKLQDCTRLGSNVECTFLFNATTKFAINESYGSGNFTIQTVNGQTFKMSEGQFSNGKWQSNLVIKAAPGTQYSGKIRIAGIPASADTISMLKFGNFGAFTNIKIQQPTAASSYPGLPSMRQQTRVNDTFYTAILHGCYPVGDKASCLVTLLADKPIGKRADNTTAYNGMLMQADNVAVIDGKASLTVGTATFKDIPVR